MKRRSFLQVVGTAAGGFAVMQHGTVIAETAPASTLERVNGMPRRVLGRTGRKVSIIVFPGLALTQQGQDEGTRGLHRAFDAGINYFDVAPAYGNGDAEVKMGVGLQGLDRSKIFLACKTKKRDAQGAREELERSLQRLKTDYFDLYQLHHVVTVAEANQALGPGGALETILKAKQEGKVRHIGFSAHSTKGALTVMNGFHFDTVMFPLSFVDYFVRGFGKDVIDLANQQGAAVVAIKPMSCGAWPEGATRTRSWWYRTAETAQEVELVLRFTLSLKGVVAGVPPSFLDLTDRAIEAARNFRELGLSELNDLVKFAWECPPLFKREDEMAAIDRGRSGHANPYEHCHAEFV